MKKRKLAVLISAYLISASAAHAVPLSDDKSLEFHGYGMVAGDFKSDYDRPKSMRLHMDPTGPHQDPRGKMGDLGNTYWHDYFSSLAVTKKWQDVGAPGQSADFTYQMVGYGDKGFETAQMFGNFAGVTVLPKDSKIWIGRRYIDERVGVFAYNTKEVHFDAGIGYNSTDFDLAVGTAQVDWSGSARPAEAVEGGRRIADAVYRLGATELGITYVEELDDPVRQQEEQNAVSVSAKYTLPSFMGLTSGNTIFKAQYGQGVIAQYLNTSRISQISEQDDSSMRFTMDGTIDAIDGFTIKPVVIFEYTDRDNTVPRISSLIDADGGVAHSYGSEDETGIFAGFDVQQKLNQNWSMLYEANVNNTQNKDGNNGANGTAYKFAMGPALQLQVQPGVAPIASLTAAYVGGDQAITELPTASEWRFGYRMEVWF